VRNRGPPIREFFTKKPGGIGSSGDIDATHLDVRFTSKDGVIGRRLVDS
jgi:hypothetical protein